jgi:hypothetical protein
MISVREHILAIPNLYIPKYTMYVQEYNTHCDI